MLLCVLTTFYCAYEESGIYTSVSKNTTVIVVSDADFLKWNFGDLAVFLVIFINVGPSNMSKIPISSLHLRVHITLIYIFFIFLSEHIDRIFQKAESRCYFVFKCFQSRNTELLVRAFTTYVRPLLEVNSQVWSPHVLKDIRRLEAVQRRFTKKHCWGCMHLLIPSVSSYLAWRD